MVSFPRMGSVLPILGALIPAIYYEGILMIRVRMALAFQTLYSFAIGQPWWGTKGSLCLKQPPEHAPCSKEPFALLAPYNTREREAVSESESESESKSLYLSLSLSLSLSLCIGTGEHYNTSRQCCTGPGVSCVRSRVTCRYVI